MERGKDGLAAQDKLAKGYTESICYFRESHMIDVCSIFSLLKRDSNCIKIDGKTIVGALDIVGEEQLKKMYFSEIVVSGKVLILTDCAFEDDSLKIRFQEACINLGIDCRDGYSPVTDERDGCSPVADGREDIERSVYYAMP